MPNFRRNFTTNMKQVMSSRLTSTISHISFIILLVLSSSLFAQEGDVAKGKTLFNTNCAACHQLDRKMTGPALRNVEARLSEEQGLDREWIYSHGLETVLDLLSLVMPMLIKFTTSTTKRL